MASNDEIVVTSYGASSSEAPKQRTEENQLLDDDDIDVINVEPIRYTFWFQHPSVKNNWKVVLGSWALLILGTILLACGLIWEFRPETDVQSFVFYIAGVICFIPGIYHVVFIYLAAKGLFKFKFSNLSAFQGTSSTV